MLKSKLRRITNSILRENMIRKGLILALCLLMTPLAAPAHRAHVDGPDFSALEALVLEEMREKNAPGAAGAIISGDRVIFSKGFGTSNIETGAPVTADMLFRLGSTTKMFTAAALVSLSEEGKLDLNAPIG